MRKHFICLRVFLLLLGATFACFAENLETKLEPMFQTLEEQHDYLWMAELFQRMDVDEHQISDDEQSRVESIYKNSSGPTKAYAFSIVAAVYPVQKYEPLLIQALGSDESMQRKAALDMLSFKLREGGKSEVSRLRKSSEIKRLISDMSGAQNLDERERKMVNSTWSLLKPEQ